MVVHHEVTGFEEYLNFMENLDPEDKNVYIFFSGNKTSKGVSWCADCTFAWPVVAGIIEAQDPESHVVYVQVGDIIDWANPQNEFRKAKDLNLLVIPTLVKFGTPKVLTGYQCSNKELLELLFEEEDEQ